MENQTSIQEFLSLYNSGQRRFKGLNIEGDLSNQDLSGVSFEDCFITADFKYADLSNSQFIGGNIKTSDFRYSNLTNAEFMNLAVESTSFDWAKTEGLKFKGNFCYGQVVAESNFEKLFKTNVSKPKFQIIDCFKLTGRDYVICGDILEGTISIGDSLELESELYEIIGVEMVDKSPGQIAHVGLVIPVFEEIEIKELEHQKLKGKEIEIIKKSC